MIIERPSVCEHGVDLWHFCRECCSRAGGRYTNSVTFSAELRVPKSWRDTFDDPPDWREGGRVEMRARDGSTVLGKITFEDFFFDGQSEIPITTLTLDDGTMADYWAFEAWRPL